MKIKLCSHGFLNFYNLHQERIFIILRKNHYYPYLSTKINKCDIKKRLQIAPLQVCLTYTSVRCSVKKDFLKNFAKFLVKTTKRLWHRCFNVNFLKF